jgi:hypothetical protein
LQRAIAVRLKKEDKMTACHLASQSAARDQQRVVEVESAGTRMKVVSTDLVEAT